MCRYVDGYSNVEGFRWCAVMRNSFTSEAQHLQILLWLWKNINHSIYFHPSISRVYFTQFPWFILLWPLHHTKIYRNDPSPLTWPPLFEAQNSFHTWALDMRPSIDRGSSSQSLKWCWKELRILLLCRNRPGISVRDYIPEFFRTELHVMWLVRSIAIFYVETLWSSNYLWRWSQWSVT